MSDTQAETYASATGAAPLSDEELRRIDAYWRAANYLSVRQIHLLENPLLREPRRVEHVKPRLLGHWGRPTDHRGVGGAAARSRTLGADDASRGR